VRRIIGSVMVAALVLIGTAACGGDDGAESGSATTAASSSGDASGGGASASDPVAKLCDLVQEIAEAGKAKDVAKVKELGEQASAAAQEATKAIISNPASAAKFGECSGKLTEALREAGIGG
jgi:hypothetical protein